MPFCEMGERVLVTGFVGWGVGDKKAWIKFFICFDDALQVKPHDFEGFKPFWDNTIPRLLAVVRDPRRVLRGAAGNLVTTLSYAGAMYAAVHAYGGNLPIAAAIVVTLGAGLVGTVAPTPGGLGAVEAALVAGLTAIGIKNSVALPAALLYRAATFLLPTIPGWLSLRLLQRADAI